MKLLKITSLGLVFVMISFSLLSIVQNQHFFGPMGVALSWVAFGLGIIILLVAFKQTKFLKKKFLVAGIGVVLAVEPFTEVLIMRAFFPSIPPIALVLVGAVLVALAVRKL